MRVSKYPIQVQNSILSQTSPLTDGLRADEGFLRQERSSPTLRAALYPSVKLNIRFDRVTNDHQLNSAVVPPRKTVDMTVPVDKSSNNSVIDTRKVEIFKSLEIVPNPESLVNLNRASDKIADISDD